jgi:endonuclease/exonuclease/phosphatase (EEP) superfamily protein YafD
MSSLLERAAIAIAAAISLAVLGGWLAGLGLVASPRLPVAVAGWIADTLGHFQLFYALGFLPVLAFLAWRRRWGTLAAAAPFAISVALQLWPYFGPGLPVAHAAGPQELRVAALNLWFRNQHLDLVARWIADENADVLVLSEVTPELRVALAPALAGYPYQTISEGETRADVLLASRTPIEIVPLESADAREYMVHARVCPAQAGDAARCAWIIGAHVPSPVSPGRIVHRDRLLAEIGAVARVHHGEPVIVLGDLNSSPWAPGFRTMAARGDLVDSARGRGIWPTWNTRLPVAQTPIDHILVGGPVTVLARAVGPDVGSDHLPVTARLRF